MPVYQQLGGAPAHGADDEKRPGGFAQLSEKPANSAHHTQCPRCGLLLEVTAREGGPEVGYDFAAWSRVCRSPHLGGPSMCLARACASGVAPSRRAGEGHWDNPAFKPLA
jgi:hypothetical protein